MSYPSRAPGASFGEPEFDVVVIASSFGGLRALATILADLPGDFPAPIMVVHHVGAESILPHLLRMRTALRVKHAHDAEPLRAGTAYVAPPQRHLLVGPFGTCRLSAVGRVNFLRPSADMLFSSAAERFGPRTLGVVLTGHLFDGTLGSAAVRAHGGVVIAQDPRTCEAVGMPETAIHSGCVDIVLSLEGIARALVSLVAVPRVTALLGIGRHRSAA